MRSILNTRLVAHKFQWQQRRGFKRMEKVRKSLPSLGVLEISPNELLLDATLPCGQSFRWKKQPDNSWFGVLGRHFVALEQHGNENKIYFASTNPSPQDMHEKLHDYFQLKIVLQDCYHQWSQVHSDDEKTKKFESINAAFGEAAERLPGIRLLRQDPHECFFSFICSQNNNIKRISQMIDKLTLVRLVCRSYSM
jgi:N-glycosylase/DNA lyase